MGEKERESHEIGQFVPEQLHAKEAAYTTEAQSGIEEQREGTEAEEGIETVS